MPTTITHNVAQRLTVVGRQQGLDMPRVLERLGIDHTHGTPRGTLTIEQVADLTRELWMLTGDELFGLGDPAPLGSFALTMRASIHVPDLRGLLERIVQASEVLSGLPSIRAAEAGDKARISVCTGSIDDPDHIAGELLTVLIHRVLAWASGRRIPLSEAHLPWPRPYYAAKYEVVLGVHPTFDNDSISLVIDRHHLDAPVIRDEADLAEYLSDQPQVWYSTREYESSVTQQVRSILHHGLKGTWPHAEEIAAQLNVSVQHLRRLLRAENTALGQIKAEVLSEAAIASLSRGEESQEALAARLGFSEASAFRRAFRRWTGHSPSLYRPRRTEH